MNDPFETLPQNTQEEDSSEFKKKKLWRNLFLLSLTVSIFLVGIFWLPLKAIQVNEFMNQPSVNLPEEGEVAEQELPDEEEPKKSLEQASEVYIKNMLPARVISINASSESEWVYFSFTQKVVKIHDPSSLEWDLAFRRGKVLTNGGATNKFGSAGVIDLGEKEFNLVANTPTESFIEDSGTRTESENKALASWYKYNYFTHKLTAKKNVYGIRTAKGKFAKVQFLNFYCANKETGCIAMRYVYQNNGTNSFLKSSIS